MEAKLEECMDLRIELIIPSKNKVLLFGESAGAIDTFVLATLAEAPKLMKVAAMESGGGRDLVTVAAAQTFQKAFLNQLDCSTPDVCSSSKSRILPAFQIVVLSLD